jgi:hypothetical protein
LRSILSLTITTIRAKRTASDIVDICEIDAAEICEIDLLASPIFMMGGKDGR